MLTAIIATDSPVTPMADPRVGVGWHISFYVPVVRGYSMAPGASWPDSFWRYLSLSLLLSCPLLPPATTHLRLPPSLGRYTISHRPLNSGVQQRHLRHEGPWTFQQAVVPASPPDCGW